MEVSMLPIKTKHLDPEHSCIPAPITISHLPRIYTNEGRSLNLPYQLKLN
jgi:hypothetical protein